MVTGGRDFEDLGFVFRTMDAVLKERMSFYEIGEPHEHTPRPLIVHGDAKGLDTLVAKWAKNRGHAVLAVPAMWDLLDKKAGILRNQQMLDWMKPDWLVAFPGGTGTMDMVRRATAARVSVIQAQPGKAEAELVSPKAQYHGAPKTHKDVEDLI
jgi:hypothetical protein